MYNIIGSRIEGLFGDFAGTGKIEASAGIRFDMIDYAIEMFKEKPVFGWGIEGFANNSVYGVYSHNNFTETLVNFGIVGFVLLYFYKVMILYRQIKMIKEAGNSQENLIYILVFVLMSVVFVLDYGQISMNSFVLNLPFVMGAAQQYLHRKEKTFK